MRQLTEQEMLHRMAAYCSSAERCPDDIVKKVLAAGLTPENAEHITERLIKEKFIDEQRYCRSFTNDKLRYNKWGRIKIDFELRKKNIPASTREEALAAIDEEDYRQRLLILLKEKSKSVKSKDDRDAWNKLFRFAAGRGFEGNIISTCLKSLFHDSDYQDFME